MIMTYNLNYSILIGTGAKELSFETQPVPVPAASHKNIAEKPVPILVEAPSTATFKKLDASEVASSHTVDKCKCTNMYKSN
jgi:hypothetical protein